MPIRRGKERDLTICLAITHMRENNLKRYFFFLFFSSLDKRYPSSSTTRRLEHQQTENEMNIHTHSKEEKKKVSHNQARTLATSTCPLRFALDVVTDSQAIAVSSEPVWTRAHGALKFGLTNQSHIFTHKYDSDHKVCRSMPSSESGCRLILSKFFTSLQCIHTNT